MADFAQYIPELKTLAEIARDLQAPLAIEGSVAKEIINRAQMDKNQEHVLSLFALVPALADIDLTCEEDIAQLLQAEISERMPISRFFHIEVRSIDDLARRPYAEFGNVEIRGMPRVSFLSDPKGYKDPNAQVHLYLGTGDELVCEAASPTDAEVSWCGGPEGEPAGDGVGALRDILFLLRKFQREPGAAHVVELLSAALRKLGGRNIAESLSHVASELERLHFALLKYVLYCAANPTAYKRFHLDHLISDHFWHELEDTLSAPLLRELIRFARMGSIPALTGIVQPTLREGRWRRRIVSVRLRPSPSQLRQRQSEFFKALDRYEALKAAAEANGAFLSPVFPLLTDEPSDPDCCRYQDFARGLAEPVWVEPRPPGRPLRQLFAIVRAPDETDPVAAHSYLKLGSISSLRLDYGFLCTIAGRRRPLEVVAMALPPEENQQ